MGVTCLSKSGMIGEMESKQAVWVLTVNDGCHSTEVHSVHANESSVRSTVYGWFASQEVDFNDEVIERRGEGWIMYEMVDGCDVSAEANRFWVETL